MGMEIERYHNMSRIGLYYPNQICHINIHIFSKEVIMISPTNEWVLSASTTLSSLLLSSSIRKREQAELSHLPKASHMQRIRLTLYRDQVHKV
jgi:hypothetical protein